MGEDDIRNYLSRQAGEKPNTALVPRVRMAPRPRNARRAASAPSPKEEAEDFQNFSATHLLCPKCKKATPVREKTLLFLPDGDLHGYSCTVCGTSVGTRKVGR